MYKGNLAFTTLLILYVQVHLLQSYPVYALFPPKWKFTLRLRGSFLYGCYISQSRFTRNRGNRIWVRFSQFICLSKTPFCVQTQIRYKELNIAILVISWKTRLEIKCTSCRLVGSCTKWDSSNPRWKFSRGCARSIFTTFSQKIVSKAIQAKRPGTSEN